MSIRSRPGGDRPAGVVVGPVTDRDRTDGASVDALAVAPTAVARIDETPPAGTVREGGRS